MCILNRLKNKDKVPFIDLYNYFSSDFLLLKELKKTEQDPIWHAEGDVFIHTEMVINELYNIIDSFDLNGTEFRSLVLAALFHDIGKPVVTKKREKDCRIQIISPKHEYVGMSYCFYRLLNYDLDIEEIYLICSLIGYHQIPKLLIVKNEDKRKFIDLAFKTNLKLIYILEKADLKGRKSNDLESQLEYLELFKLYSIEYGVWENAEKLLSEVYFKSDYAFYRGIKSYINNEIYQLEEANLKFFSEDFSKVIIVVGLSGTGKSYYINNYLKHNKNFHLISLDDLRKQYPKKTKKNDGFIVNESRKILKEYLALNKNVIVDATHYRKDFRTKIIDLVEAYNGFVEIHFIFDKIDNIINKDIKRKESVGKEVILKQYNKFEYPEIDESFCIKHIDLRKLTTSP